MFLLPVREVGGGSVRSGIFVSALFGVLIGEVSEGLQRHFVQELQQFASDPVLDTFLYLLVFRFALCSFHAHGFHPGDHPLEGLLCRICGGSGVLLDVCGEPLGCEAGLFGCFPCRILHALCRPFEPRIQAGRPFLLHPRTRARPGRSSSAPRGSLAIEGQARRRASARTRRRERARRSKRDGCLPSPSDRTEEQ
eukprot:scaffold431_cov334-Pavlova_lutheri.AAC.42